MAATTRLVGLILAVIGIVSYVGTGRTSMTALIPAFIGAVLLVLAYVARSEAARRHAMHVAMVVALLGILGSGQRLIGATDFTRPATLAQLATVLLLAWLLGKGIQSFREARRARG
jgi:hypothetical protein